VAGRVAAAHRAQADALEIEAQAKRRLADEYDAAQERGEIASRTDGDRSSKAEDLKPTATEVLGEGAHKLLHEARLIRDAEVADPGITIRRALDEKLVAGEEPTKAASNQVQDAAGVRVFKLSTACTGGLSPRIK